MRTCVSLAHGLNLKVVAEGVETEAQAAKLRELALRPGPGLLLQPAGAGGPAARCWRRSPSGRPEVRDPHRAPRADAKPNPASSAAPGRRVGAAHPDHGLHRSTSCSVARSRPGRATVITPRLHQLEQHRRRQFGGRAGRGPTFGVSKRSKPLRWKEGRSRVISTIGQRSSPPSTRRGRPRPRSRSTSKAATSTFGRVSADHASRACAVSLAATASMPILRSASTASVRSLSSPRQHQHPASRAAARPPAVGRRSAPGRPCPRC